MIRFILSILHRGTKTWGGKHRTPKLFSPALQNETAAEGSVLACESSSVSGTYRHAPAAAQYDHLRGCGRIRR